MGAEMRNGILNYARFKGCNMMDVDFSETDLIRTQFYNVVLSGSVFKNAKLQDVVFIQCDLRGTNITNEQWSKRSGLSLGNTL
jgi:uncharacterized protein YjbI with pentapeptide repeats